MWGSHGDARVRVHQQSDRDVSCASGLAEQIPRELVPRELVELHLFDRYIQRYSVLKKTSRRGRGPIEHY